MPRQRLYVAIMVALPALFSTGCAPSPACFRSVLGTHTTGAKLEVPATATAGDTVTLDATGSGLESEGRPCPVYMWFTMYYESNRPIEAGSIRKPPTAKTVDGGCVVVDGKVQVKIPAAPAPGERVLNVAVTASVNPSFRRSSNVRSSVTKPISVVTPGAGTSAGAGAPSSPPASTNQPPVARFFSDVEPLITGREARFLADESFDPDGSIAAFEWDTDGDGAFERTTTTPLLEIKDGYATAGTRKVTLRVRDDKGATTSASIDLPVNGGPDTFTEGEIRGLPLEAAVGTPISVEARNVDGAAGATLDADNDGEFDDGTVTAPLPGTFAPVTFATGGWKRIRVKWSSVAPPKTTVTTELIKITPFVQSAAAFGRPGRTPTTAWAAKGTNMVATLRSTVTPLSLGKVSLAPDGVRTQGLTLRGRLRGKVRVSGRSRGAKVPPGVAVLRNAVFAGRFNASARPVGETFAPPKGSGVIVARDPRSARTQLCLRVTQDGAATTRFSVLGATGQARGLRASGTFPALVGEPGTTAASTTAKITFTVTRGPAKPLSAVCRALVRSQQAKTPR